MDSYLWLKLVHVLSATVLMGTGCGIAFFMWVAARADNPQVIAHTTRYVVLADWLFTAPAVIIQAGSGVLLMKLLGFSFQAPWFSAVSALFLFVGLCWLPVVVIQYKLRTEAKQALQQGRLSERFKQLMRLWLALGMPAFAAMLILFWLMIFKPLSVV
ncbi:MAG: DUF2269 family protein [Pseudomonadales bacterium]